MKRIIFWLLFLVAIGGAVAAFQLAVAMKNELPKASPVSEPPKSPVERSIGARGLVESVDENVRIAPAVGGLVLKVPVKVGVTVKEGDTLIEQDTRAAAASVTAMDADLAAMRALLGEAEVQLADKRDMLDRTEALSARKVASEDEVKRAQFAAQSAEAMVGSMKAKIASADAQLARSKVQLDLLTIRAPRAGRVLQVNVRPGEFADIKPQEPLILLGDDGGTLQLRADVDEVNAHRVSKTAKAWARLKGRGDVKVDLRFERFEPFILPKKSLTGDSSERVDTRVLQIIYRFERPEGVEIYIGQQMDVFIEDVKK